MEEGEYVGWQVGRKPCRKHCSKHRMRPTDADFEACREFGRKFDIEP